MIDCIEGRWTMRACEDACAPGLHRGCEGDADAGACICEPDPAAAHYTCVDETTLLECKGDDCSELACNDVCNAAFEGWTATDCHDGFCQCSAIGTPCPTGAAPRCGGAILIYECEDEAWTAHDCRSECDLPLSGLCRTAPDGVPACSCEQ